MSIAEKLTVIAENEQKVYEAGYNAGVSVPPKKPYIDSSCIVNYGSFFQNGRCDLSQVENVDVSNGTNFARMFMYRTDLKTVPVLETGKGKDFLYLFYNCQQLVSVGGIDFTSAVTEGSLNYMFYGCEKLEEIRFNGTISISGIDLQWSTLLSKDSVISLLNALSRTAESQELTLPSEVTDLWDSQDEFWDFAEGDTINWTINLI